MATLAEVLANTSGDSSIYDIIQKRYQLAGNQEAQDALGPMDHQAFARQVMIDSPVWRKPINALGLSVAIPGYEAAKALHLTDRDNMTSRPSLASILAGYKGLMHGVLR
jgi:hypothetical protein